MSIVLTNRSVDSTTFLRVTSTSKNLTFSFDQSAVNFIVGWNELISLMNSFSDPLSCSQIKILSIYLHQTFSFLLILFKIFSSKAAIKGTEYGWANCVPTSFSEFVSKFYQEIKKCYFLIQVQQVLSKCLLWPVRQLYCPKNPLEKQGFHHVGYLDKDQEH